MVDRLARKGLTARVASELEFFLFNHTYHEVFGKRYADLIPSSDYRIDYHTFQPTREEPLLRAVRNQLTAAGVPIEATKGEWGKGQHEVNARYGRPLTAADNHAVLKQGVKEIAAQHGQCVTFMA